MEHYWEWLQRIEKIIILGMKVPPQKLIRTVIYRHFLNVCTAMFPCKPVVVLEFSTSHISQHQKDTFHISTWLRTFTLSLFVWKRLLFGFGGFFLIFWFCLGEGFFCGFCLHLVLVFERGVGILVGFGYFMEEKWIVVS